MTNKMSKTVIIGSIICSLVLLGVLSTFAYITLSPAETKENLGVEAGSLALTFADGNNGITEALEFGGSVEKTFSIENTGSLNATARIMWDDLVNTYLDGSLTYTLSSSDTETGTYINIVENQNVPTNTTSAKELLAGNLTIPNGSTKYYKLTIKLNYLDSVDQTADLKASLSTHFSIEESNGKDFLLSGSAGQTMKKLGKIINQDKLNFALQAITDETSDGLFELEDDYGTSYFYRGDVTDNYVKFGKWSETSSQTDKHGKDMYWRIIRVNGDGSVRLLYDGTSAHANNDTTEDRVALKNVFNNLYDDAKYIGYMYGPTNTVVGKTTSSTDVAHAQMNTVSSDIKTKLEEWYVENLSSEDISIADSLFCYDRTIPGKTATGWSSDTGIGYGKSITAYGAYSRLGVQPINYENVHLKFKCENKNNAFTKSDTVKGNGALGQKIGLITADEVVAAGSGKYNTSNESYYLYKGLRYYTGSPSNFNGANALLFCILNNGSLNHDIAGNINGITPVISLTPEYFNTLIGDGTQGNPFREKGMEP